MANGINPLRQFSTPKIFVSWGEIIDKLTILEIKIENLNDPIALENVRREMHILLEAAKAPLSNVKELVELKDQLANVNRLLWKIEDDIRDKEHKQEFDDEFIKLARLVYLNNDDRARIKKAVNLLLGSEIVEEKKYKLYLMREVTQ